MSNIYIQEPPTSGKVLLITTVGDIDVELWSKETPKACRNFVQLCLENYYNNTIFHRVVKDFIVQGGDPAGTGEGGDSIYGAPFKDEIHSRLRFNRRGLLAMANAGRDDNGSQFFFTFAATPELQGKHTIFAKVVGDTIYNMLKLEGETDENERPLHCHKIIRTEVLNNPFDDIVPRVIEQKTKKDKKKEKKQGVKNFKLLSFGEEAEEDEEETREITKSSKIKSSHDILDDPKLSSEPALLKSDLKEVESSESETEDAKANEEDEVKDDYYLGKSRDEELEKRRADIQKQIQDLKEDYRNRKKPKEVDDSSEPADDVDSAGKSNEVTNEYKANLFKYGEMKKKFPLKRSEREKFTMEMLSKFKNKLQEVRDTVGDDEKELTDDNDTNWMAHSLKFDNQPTLARDANTKSDDWYDFTDPRNPINKRRREASKEEMKKHSKRTKD